VCLVISPGMATEKKRPRGRPPIPEEERASERLVARVRPDELASYQAASERAGLSLSEWVREVLGRAARRATRA